MFEAFISADELAEQLGTDNLVVFDCRADLKDSAAGYRMYLDGHIPGAIHADLDRNLAAPLTPDSGRHPLPDPDEFRAWLGAGGVAVDTQVVCYDAAGGSFAARLWWMLRWLGHEAIAVLAGGLPAWQEQPGALESGAASPRRGMAPYPGEPRPGHWVDTKELGSADLRKRLIDLRTTERFLGEQEPIDPVAGHIPGAGNLPWPALLDEQLRPFDALTSHTTLAGVDASDASIFMCGSGVTACMGPLLQVHAGEPPGRVYAGSWSEWIRNRERPRAP